MKLLLLCRDYGLGFCANSLALGCDCLVSNHLWLTKATISWHLHLTDTSGGSLRDPQ